jgi:hypothetical protein
MSSGPKKTFLSFPPDFRLPDTASKQGAKAGTASASAPNSSYYRQGVLVPGGPPIRAVSRNRPR